MKRLIVFGDSFSSTNYCVDVDQSFYGLLAKELQVDCIINYSWPGNDFTSIKHLLVNEIDQFDSNNDYIVIGLPPLERVTLFDPDGADNQHSRAVISNNWNIKQEKITSLESTMTGPVYELIPGYIAVYERSWHEAMALTDVALLHSFIASKGFKFMIVNLAQPFQEDTQWNTLANLIAQTKKYNNIIVFNDTYYSVNYQKNMPVDYDKYGWFGHHGPDGNQRWFDVSIKPMAQSLGWL